MPQTQKFGKLLKATESYYTGKRVPKVYQSKYGKVYQKHEARNIAYAIAKKQGWKV